MYIDIFYINIIIKICWRSKFWTSFFRY